MKCVKMRVHALAGLVILGAAAPSFAVPYASGVRNTTGTSYEFILNESADNVTVQRDGANAVDLGPLSAGRHTFDLGAFSTYDIQVAKDTPAAWTEISDATNLHTNFLRPVGVVVNQDPTSAFFGTVYVSHPLSVPEVAFTRAMGDGIYSLSADRIGIDLANNFAAVADANDETLAKLPTNWTVENNGGSSPWRLTLDDGGNLIAADFSDQNGGIKYASPDLTTGGLVLANEDGILPLLVNGAGQEVHGSILSKPSVTGTVETDLTVWAIDEDYDLDGDTFNIAPGETFAQTSTYHPLRWDVGSATDYDLPPTVVINKEMMDIDDDMGTPDPADDFNDTAYTLSPEEIGGVIVNNLHYEEQFDKFYIMQSRTHGNESGLFIVTADGIDGNSPTVDWSSKRFSFDNGLDGNNSIFITDEETGEMAYGEGIQDIFRNIDDVVISADGSTMYVSRLRQFGPDDFDPDSSVPADGDNPVLGLDSNLPGAVLVIPLDENGIPDIQIDNNGTPNDTSDDFLSNVDSISLETVGRTLRNQIGLDAAGNVYSIDNLTERLQVFSPGGNTLATTSSGGTFDVQTIVAIDGDFNGDGMVTALDYVIWRNNLGATEDGSILSGNGNGGTVDETDYELWVANFGNTSGSGALGLAASVPEPATWLLLLLMAAGGLALRR
ncbi:MAG: PEP-CTERM sorting domain-containing protein [Aeoliella sp.]